MCTRCLVLDAWAKQASPVVVEFFDSGRQVDLLVFFQYEGRGNLTCL